LFGFTHRQTPTIAFRLSPGPLPTKAWTVPCGTQKPMKLGTDWHPGFMLILQTGRRLQAQSGEPMEVSQ
jgi:hypothetical protein